MTTLRNLIAMICMTGLSLFASAQSAPPRVAPADAKNHIGESATICGKVVDTKISKYGIAGRGKPVVFDLDQPEPNPVFYFVAFGAEPGGPGEAIEAYKGKSVCVTGKITATGGTPYIMAGDRTLVKIQTQTK